MINGKLPAFIKFHIFNMKKVTEWTLTVLNINGTKSTNKKMDQETLVDFFSTFVGIGFIATVFDNYQQNNNCSELRKSKGDLHGCLKLSQLASTVNKTQPRKTKKKKKIKNGLT